MAAKPADAQTSPVNHGSAWPGRERMPKHMALQVIGYLPSGVSDNRRVLQMAEKIVTAFFESDVADPPRASHAPQRATAALGRPALRMGGGAPRRRLGQPCD